MNKKKTKIIHVHFFSGHKNYYFGSVTAIFKMFTSKEIGARKPIFVISSRRKAIITSTPRS